MATYNYTVTASGNSYYLWNGHGLVDAQNPDLFFRAGDAITITKGSTGHPMRITNDAAPSVDPIDESGGQIYVSSAAEGTFTYFCTSHPSAMIGAITVSRAYANEGPEHGYGTGPLIGHDAGPLSMNEIRTKINEIITKGGVGGTTTSTGGGSISVSTDAPGSPSDGDLWWDSDTASLYVYFAERSAWIQTNGAVGGGANFSTGWVNTDGTTTVADGATLAFNHNLGTADLIFNVYVADDVNGTNAFRAGDAQDAGFNTAYGASIQSVTDSSFVLQLGSGGTHGGAMTMNSSGDKSFLDYAGKYVKVIISAGGGGGGGGSGTPAGSDREIQFNDNGAFGANANLKFDGSSAFLPRLEVGEGAASGDEGAEIFLKHAVTNSTLAGDGVAIDIYQNKLRFFEYGGSFRGAYIDFTECGAELSGGMTNLLAGGGDASIEVSATAPDPAEDGDLWFNTTQAELYVYVNSESAWIQTNSGGGGGSGGGAEWLVVTGGQAYQESQAKTLQIENFNANTDLIFYGFSGTQIPGDGSQIQLYQNQVAQRGQSDGYVYARMTSTGLLSVWSSANRNQSIPNIYILRLNSSGSGGGGPRAYVAFDGTSSNLTGSITNSFNVSSITDNATGNYTINYTTPVPNPIISMSNEVRSSSPYFALYFAIMEKTESSVKIGMGSNNIYYDHPYVSVTVH